MVRSTIKRIVLVVPVVLAVTIIIFFLSSLSAGDPARIRAEQRFNHPTAEQIEMIREEMGLNRPLPAQKESL